MDTVKAAHPTYHCGPVAAFGERDAGLLVVGLAPGKHGANATGRPFTGDHAGRILYKTLHRFGFASRPESTHRRDGLRLIGCRITNAVKCLPPENKPVAAEVRECRHFLAAELATVGRGGVILVLGGLAHQATLRALEYRLRDYPFGHGLEYELSGGRTLLSSYHCSRYNTQTRRLTEPMFVSVIERARAKVDAA